MPVKLKDHGGGKYSAVSVETGAREGPLYAGKNARARALAYVQARNMAYQRKKGNRKIPPRK